MSGTIELSRDGHVATITFSNPPTHTLTDPMVAELDRITEQLLGDAELRVLVLTGAGDGVFIAHYEVAELAEGAAAAQAGEERGPGGGGSRPHRLNRVLLRLEQMRAITVAAINGTAMGGGCETTLACDFRVMADGDFRYGLPETSVGIIPGAGGTQRLPRLIGVARALDLILHARVVTPAEALELGMIHRVYPAASFRDEVAAFVADLAERAPIALGAAKAAVHKGIDADLETGLFIEQAAFRRTMQSKDAGGAMRAWLEGRPYEFQRE